MNSELILVIDDERIILELTSMILRSRGYEVLTAPGGEEGLRLVEECAPSLVLLDYMMPRLDGMTVLRTIRDRFPDTYVIMFTGKGSEEIAVELMKSGASDYLLKPFNNQDLLDRIEGVLRLRRIELHNRELLAERERLLAEIESWNRELERRVEEKSIELEQAQAEIIQVEKLAALGHLSAGMAHEIRNPLNTIGLFTQILKNSVADDADQLDYLDKIQNEVERIDDLLVRLLAASRPSRSELIPLSLSEAAESALEMFQPQLHAQGIRVVRDYASHLPQLPGDIAQLRQVFNNLFINSIHEMAHGGALTVRIFHDERGLYVDVADTGGGIAREHLNSIFDPFFTTKPRGTGFGLSVVLRIVKTYGGRISVESDVGRGTTFHLFFPLV